jgi:hypothetical protein
MRNLINILVLFVTLTTFGQDREFLDYVNTYRVKNGVKAVKWDYTIAEKSAHQVDTLIKSVVGDTVYIFHNQKGGWENVAYLGGLGACDGFDKFLDEYYDLPPFDPVNVTDTIKYIKLGIIFMWSESKGHNDNMLKESHKKAGCDTHIYNIHFVDNKKTLLGKTYILKFNPSLVSKTFGVINFE